MSQHPVAGKVSEVLGAGGAHDGYLLKVLDFESWAIGWFLACGPSADSRRESVGRPSLVGRKP